MTIKRRIYRNFFGKKYPMGWEILKPGMKENISVFGHVQTLVVAKDSNSVCFIPPEGDNLIIDMIQEDQINQLNRSLRHAVLYSLGKDGLEDKKLELAWEATLPRQAKK